MDAVVSGCIVIDERCCTAPCMSTLVERNPAPLRISIVSETWFPQINGVSHTLDKLVEHCCSHGDELQLIVPRYGREGVQHAGARKTALRGFPLPCYPEVMLPLASPGRLRRELHRFAPQLVHIATEGTLGLAALRAAGQLGLPVVSSYHTNFPRYLEGYRLGRLEPLAWRYLRWFHNRTRMTLCPTPSIQNLLEARGFRRLALWSRGVDSGFFHPQNRDAGLRRSLGFLPRETVIVYLGRLAAEKNLEMLFDAFRRVPAEAACRLLIIGDGPLGEGLREKADPRCVFVGYRRGRELARMLAVGDLLVFPSLTDTFGNVMLEGMASGLPVLGFRVPGPQDVIADGRTGRIVDSATADCLAQAIFELAADRNKLISMGGQARAFAENQSWYRIMEEVREKYRHHLAITDPSEFRSGNEGRALSRSSTDAERWK